MNALLQNKLEEIQKICEAYKVKQLYAFGSVCGNTFNSKSDIDLLISFQEISIDEYTENYFALHNIFSQLFNRPVDLVTEKSLSNPYFIQSIEQQKTLLYAA